LNLLQALACATTNPTRLLGVKKRGALPRVGQRANFMVAERKKNGQVKVEAVFIDGERRTTNEHE
jgi:alpha-D-ribose 1-methylphosphonate 5-triphosphate diphosphatase PhnM